MWIRRIAAAVATCGCAWAVLASPALARTADDGATGTYVAYGATVFFDFFNAGTTGWQSFAVTGPVGTEFVGGANGAEFSARCVPGQPDGSAAEIACGPLTPALASHTHVTFVATLATPPACGSVFQLRVSSSAGTLSPPVDVTAAGSCATSAPRALRPPAIRGTAVAGRTLVAKSASWSADPARVAYRWQRCRAAACVPIRGAIRLTLRLTRADTGHDVQIVATASIDGLTVTSASKRIAVRP